MNQTIAMQSFNRSKLDRSRLASYERESIAFPTKPLIHMDARFLFLISGSGTIRIGGRSCDLAPGSLVVLLPWQISEITRVDEPLQYDLIAFHYDTVSASVKLFLEPEGKPLQLEQAVEEKAVVQLGGTSLREAEQLVSMLREELGMESVMGAAQPGAFSSIRTVSLLTLLLTVFLRAGGEEEPVEAAQQDYREILRYMYLHCSEKITLQELSEKFFCSKSTISAHISSLTGLSFFDLLNEIRIGKTVNYLLYTDMTLKELAEILGYVDESHISKVFAARLGTRIGEYRDTYQKVENICCIEQSRLGYSIVNYIYRNYASPISAQEVARKFGISVAKLNQTLLYRAERTFEELLNLIRVNRACELLESTRLTVLEVALEVGYQTAKTLTRSFLKYRQMPPGAYRTMVQNREK